MYWVYEIIILYTLYWVKLYFLKIIVFYKLNAGIKGIFGSAFCRQIQSSARCKSVLAERTYHQHGSKCETILKLWFGVFAVNVLFIQQSRVRVCYGHKSPNWMVGKTYFWHLFNILDMIYPFSLSTLSSTIFNLTITLSVQQWSQWFLIRIVQIHMVTVANTELCWSTNISIVEFLIFLLVVAPLGNWARQKTGVR